MYVEQLTQQLSPYDYLPPQAVNNTTVSTNGIDMSKFKRAIYFVEAGNLGAAGVVAVVVQSAKLSNFATPHNMTSVAVTNMATNNTVISVEVRSDQVTYQNSGDQFVRLNIVGSGNSLTVGALGLGGEAVQGPASQFTNTTTVPQSVTCST